MKINEKKPVYAAGISAAMAAVFLGVTGCAAGAPFPDTIRVQNMDSVSDKITVTGKEEVRVVPDVAEIVYSVYTKKETAEECQAENARSLDAAIAVLKNLGVEEKSIQTSSYGLSPINDWNSPDQEITGYEMTTRLTVSDIPIAEAGHLLSESVAAGVNGIDSVSYYATAYDEAYREALKGAMESAKAKAEAIAEAGGRKITGVSHVEEYGYNPIARNSTYRAGAKADAGPGASADMAVMPGELSVEAQVTVDYSLE